jgi:hypothetical protein
VRKLKEEKLEQLRIIFSKEIKNLMKEFKIAMAENVPFSIDEWVDIIVNKFSYEIKICINNK